MIITLHGKINHASLESYNHICPLYKLYLSLYGSYFVNCCVNFNCTICHFAFTLWAPEEELSNWGKNTIQISTKGPILLSETVLKRYFEETFAASSKWSIHSRPYYLHHKMWCLVPVWLALKKDWTHSPKFWGSMTISLNGSVTIIGSSRLGD